MKSISKNILTIIIIAIIILATFPSYINAASTNGFTSFNNAPRKYFTVSSSKLADVTLRIEDNNGIKAVVLYSVDSKGKQKQIKFSSSNTKDKTKHIYTLSHSKLLKGKTKAFYIKIRDNSGNAHYSGFRVCVKTKTVNKKKVKYYSIDDGPRVTNWKASNNKVSFKVTDNGGSKYAKVQDGNNNNKEIYNFRDLKAGGETVTIDMSKFKLVNGIYKLRIVTADKASTPQQTIRNVYFKIPAVKTNTTTNKTTTSISKNKTLKVLFVGNSKTYVNDIPAKFAGLAKAGGYKVSISTATQGGKTLKYLASKYKSKINKSYDIVILQEQTDAYKGKYSTFLSGAKSISKMVKAKNPNVKIYVRQTWVYKNSSSSERNKAYTNAKNVAKNINASLIYDGKAMYKLNASSLYKDRTHQSSKGAYLSACCIYNSVFNESPVGLSYKAGLSSSTVKKLQQVANTVYKAETK